MLKDCFTIAPHDWGQMLQEVLQRKILHYFILSWLGSEAFGTSFYLGNPDPLVFHVPQKFFDCLQQRISVSSKKKRLPNSSTAFVRKDALPLGTFTKYTWNIMNILHVKQIFDTPMVSAFYSGLELKHNPNGFLMILSFVHNLILWLSLRTLTKLYIIANLEFQCNVVKLLILFQITQPM